MTNISKNISNSYIGGIYFKYNKIYIYYLIYCLLFFYTDNKCEKHLQ